MRDHEGQYCVLGSCLLFPLWCLMEFLYTNYGKNSLLFHGQYIYWTPRIYICVGIKAARLDKTSPDQIGQTSLNQEKHDDIEPESCPFSWARSPENMLRQETYLALATTFVLLRLLHFIFPFLVIFVQCSWRRHIHNMSAGAMQVFNSFNREPYKRSNLQEGAMSAKAWASKSLASVSIGEASSSRSASLSERH